MAKSQIVLKDLNDNCGMFDGNIPGKYRLDFAEIDYGGISHRIDTYTQKIYIFEDIDKFGVTGWIEMIDMDNLVSGFFKEHTIVGQELLKLKFRTQGSHLPVDFVTHPLTIHKVENLRSLASGDSGSIAAQQYRIHFCSPEILNNDRIRISQTYEDTYDNMIKSIMVDHLKTKKDIWLEPTDGIHKIVIPNMHPFDAINMILQDSRSAKYRLMPNYNFYETTKGFRYKTKYIGSLATVSGGGGGDFGSGTDSMNTDWQLRLAIETVKTPGNYVQEMSMVKSYKYTRLGDTYAAIKDGMFASKSIEHDTFNKTFNIRAATYLSNVKNPFVEQLTSTRIGIIGQPYIREGSVYVPSGEKFAPQEPFEKSETYTEFPDSRINFYSTGTKHAHDFVTSDGSIKSNDAGPNKLQFNHRQMQQKHDRYFQLQVVTHGFSGLQVGDSLTLDVPLIGVTGQQEPKTDPRFSNDAFYIIKLVHHIELAGENPTYECILDLAPMSAARDTLPYNAKFSGQADTGKGQRAGYFRGTSERNTEAD